jgi:hypothetical protein
MSDERLSQVFLSGQKIVFIRQGNIASTARACGDGTHGIA